MKLFINKILIVFILVVVSAFYLISNFYVNSDERKEVEEELNNASLESISFYAQGHENTLDMENISLSYDNKVAKEKKLNIEASRNINVFSEESRYLMLVSKKLDLPSELLQRVRAGSTTYEDEKLIQLLISSTLTEEENFDLEIKQLESFKALKAATDKRGILTGLFYGNAILNEGITYRDAAVEDIEEIIKSGAELPGNVLQKIIAMDNIDLAVDLHKKGFSLNVGHVDELTSITPIEMIADLYVIHPYDSPKAVADKINKLIGIGVPIKINDGTRDPLDFVLAGALTKNGEGAENLIQLAIELNKMGLQLDVSHREILEKLKIMQPMLFEKYENELR